MPSPLAPRHLPTTPHRTSRPTRTARKLLAVTSLGLAGLLAGLLSGCAGGTVAASTANPYAQASGNWQFTSTSSAAAPLSSLGGSLSVQGSGVTALLHPLATSSQCLAATTAIPATGSVDTSSRLSLSALIAGGTLSLSGTLSPDRKSLTGATYTVAGGTCAFPAAHTISARDTSVPITAQQYQPISGTYSGTLTTSDGQSFPLTSTLTQTSQPDVSGIYHLQGSASSPGNTCVPASLPATASTIAGSSISTTYTNISTGSVITGIGTTSPDGATITITGWTIQSVCGSSSGTGILTRQ